jgi:hypothetical protein
MTYLFTKAEKWLMTMAAISAVSLSASGQLNTFSPYSRFGPGILAPAATPAHFGMAGLLSINANPYAVNSRNPATYAYVSQPLFEVGGEGQIVRLNDGSEGQTARLGGVNTISFAFPMPVKPMAISFGIRPFSTMGYRQRFIENIDGLGNVIYDYSGTGGFNRAHLGMSWKFKMQKHRRDSLSTANHDLALGANINAIFGSLETTRKAIIQDPSFLNTRTKELITAKDVIFSGGFLYRKTVRETFSGPKLKNRIDLSIGGTFELGSDVTSRYSRLSESYRLTGNFESVVDTSFFIDNVRGVFSLPSALSGGIGLDIANARGGNLFIGADLSLRNWSLFQLQYEGYTPIESPLSDMKELTFGMQYTPRDYYTAGISAFQRMNYRIGLRHNTGYLLVNGNRIAETGLTTGMHIPFRWSGSRSGMNLGTEVGKRGTTANAGVEETYLRFQIGFSLTPYFGNKWFVRRKYD